MEIPPQTTVANLRVMLEAKFLSLNGLANHSLVAVDRKYVLDEFEIPGGAEGLRGILAVLNSDKPLDAILDYITLYASRMTGNRHRLSLRQPQCPGT
jgi:hypothetical protein